MHLILDNMKKVLLLILAVVMISCNDRPFEDDFEYDFSVTRTNLFNDLLSDSITFYYKNDNTLQKAIRWNLNSAFEYTVSYLPTGILSWDGMYYFDDDDRINKVILDNEHDHLRYEDDYVIYESHSWIPTEKLTDEYYYTYEEGNMVRDSMIHYGNDSTSYMTQYIYTHFDTLVPSFVPGYNGLYEMSVQNTHLRKKGIAIGAGFHYDYTYELSEAEYIIHEHMFDSVANKYNATWTYKYTLGD